MSDLEKPVLPGSFPNSAAEANPEMPLVAQIRALMLEQPYAVLCTEGRGQPYGSMIAFAANQELNTVVFATPVATHKFRLLTACDQVALVVDNRTHFTRESTSIHAVTAMGSAVILEQRELKDEWRRLLIDKHPQMQDFIRAPGTALIRIDILRYLHVTRLQEFLSGSRHTHHCNPPKCSRH